MEILPVGAKLFHADGRTDMKKLIVAFRKFDETSKKYTSNRHFQQQESAQGFLRTSKEIIVEVILGKNKVKFLKAISKLVFLKYLIFKVVCKYFGCYYHSLSLHSSYSLLCNIL